MWARTGNGYSCAHAPKCIYTYHICVRMYVNKHMCLNVYVCIYIYIYVCACMNFVVHVCCTTIPYICTRMCIHISIIRRCIYGMSVHIFYVQHKLRTGPGPRFVPGVAVLLGLGALAFAGSARILRCTWHLAGVTQQYLP